MNKIESQKLALTKSGLLSQGDKVVEAGPPVWITKHMILHRFVRATEQAETEGDSLHIYVEHDVGFLQITNPGTPAAKAQRGYLTDPGKVKAATLPAPKILADAISNIARESMDAYIIADLVRNAAQTCAQDQKHSLLQAASTALGIGDIGASEGPIMALCDEAWELAVANEFRRELIPTEFGTLGFIHKGSLTTGFLTDADTGAQYNPKDGMTESIPRTYGFIIAETGGGCTAWYQQFLFDGAKASMYVTTDMTHEIEVTDSMAVEVMADSDDGEVIFGWTQLPVPLNDIDNRPSLLPRNL